MEGNLESKVFTDPITGLVRRIREIAVRQNGTFTSVVPKLKMRRRYSDFVVAVVISVLSQF